MRFVRLTLILNFVVLSWFLLLAVPTTAPQVNAVPKVVKVKVVKKAVTRPVNKPALKPCYRLIAITATWCGPCRAAKPTVEEIEAKRLAQVIRIDIDEQQDLAQKYEITAVPTFVLFQDEKEVLRTHDIEEVKTLLKTAETTETAETSERRT